LQLPNNALGRCQLHCPLHSLHRLCKISSLRDSASIALHLIEINPVTLPDLRHGQTRRSRQRN
jgi:hypothetical protein